MTGCPGRPNSIRRRPRTSLRSSRKRSEAGARRSATEHRRAYPGCSPRAGRLLRAPLRPSSIRRRRSSPRSARRKASPTSAQVITAPGDIIVVPNPTYPIHVFGFLMAGGAFPARSSCRARRRLRRARERAVKHSIPKPIAVVVCYPSNRGRLRRRPRFLPRSHCLREEACASGAVGYRRRRGLFRRQAAAVGAAGSLALSMSPSNSARCRNPGRSMPGWRIGFAVGNERIIAALARVKSYLDYGAFTPVQVAATAALNGPDHSIEEMRATLSAPARRAGRFVRPRRMACAGGRGLRDVRLGADPRAVSIAGQRRVLHAAGREGERCRISGAGFGEYGEGHARIASVENEQRIPAGRPQHPSLP